MSNVFSVFTAISSHGLGSADAPQRLYVTVHVLVLRVVGEHHPPARGCEPRVTCHASRVTWEQSPVVCGRLDVHPVPVETAVAVGGEGAAGPHAHRVHVVPGEAEHNMCEH